MKPKHVGVAAALGLHLALFVLLSHNPRMAQRSVPGKAARPPLQVRLLPIPPPKLLPARPQSATPPAQAAMRKPARSLAVRRLPEPELVPQQEPAGPTITLAPAAAASEPLPSLLNTEATRRAIRDSARTASIGERAAQASEEPRRLAPDQRLGQEVAKAARGDCLKGEFVGGGMGLLSLPFLIAAELREKCRR